MLRYTGTWEQLENMGFVEYDYEYAYGNEQELTVDKINRELCISPFGYDGEICGSIDKYLEKIYDLIKMDLLEKVVQE